MNGIRILQRLARLPRRIVRESLMVVQVVRFFILNRLTGRSVIANGGPVVSLTTYGGRSRAAYFAIESIANGDIRPSWMILWIDDEMLFNNLPATIRRLEKRGLEVRLSKKYGPHTKYYPFIDSQNVFTTPLVTADDDILYPSYWLKRLVEANQGHPDNVNCYWAHVMNTEDDGIGKYANYEACSSTLPSVRNIALGVMGVIYPPRFLQILKDAGTAFTECCPKADDLWLHVQALRHGYRVRQVQSKLPYFSFQGVPGSQRTALSYENVTYGDGNDRQVKATYSEADIRLLKSDENVATN